MQPKDPSAGLTAEQAFAQGMDAKRQGRFREAIQLLLLAVELDPHHAFALTTLGGLHRHRGEPDRAIDFYERAERTKPSSASKIGLAAVYRDQGEHGRSITLYESVLETDAGNAYALNGLGAAYMDVGRINDAESCFRRAAEGREGRRDARKGLQAVHRAYLSHMEPEAAQRVQAFLLDIPNG